MSSSRREEATRLLTHYVELIARRAGVKWNSDNSVEVKEIVDLIFDEIDDQVSGVLHEVQQQGREQ